MTERDLEQLAAGVLEAETSALADALALVEDSRPELVPPQRTLLGALAARTPESHTVVGLTGAPGVGKSTLAGALIGHWTDRGLGVGVTAVDPSSRASGGALLGDRARLRIEPHAPVFVRSMAARDQLGGLAPATRAAVVVLRAAFPWTLVETVGVGQSEIDIDSVADSVALVLQPGSGDTLQFMKAGILEIPDLLVVHKWDLGAAAERTRADLSLILRADAGKDAVDQPQLRLLCGHVTADLRHQCDQRHLPQVSGFPGHIGTGDDHDLVAVTIESRGVGDERIGRVDQFHQRVTSVDEIQCVAIR